jgi:hypothetical protein
MTSKRASKSAKGVREEKWLRPAVWRFTPVVARLMRKFAREKHVGPGLAQAGTGCDFYFLSPQVSARLYLPKLASRGVFPPR